MRIIKVTLFDKTYNIYVVSYMGEEVYVADFKLEQRIIEAIKNEDYFSNNASINGKQCKVKDISNMYYYVLGEIEDVKDDYIPTEQEIIDSIADVWEGNP